MSDQPTEPSVEPTVIANVTAAPFIVNHPYIAVGPTGSEVEFHCAGTNLTVSADQDENTIETFCGSYVTYKPPVWTVTATSAMSYGTTGLWNLLQPLVNTTQPFEVRPDTAVAGPTNPSMKGSCVVKAFSFIDAAPGEVSEVDVVLAVQGAPTFATA